MTRDDAVGPDEWADRFEQQALACDELGSPLWGRLLRIVAADVRADGPSWAVVRERADLRFGQAGPLRLVGAAHRLALTGSAPEWAALLPSCGGVAPASDEAGAGAGASDGDRVLRAAWAALVDQHHDELVAGMDREVQTNEVGRAAALGYAHTIALADPIALAGWARPARLVEIGCSGGLNLRLDRFCLDLSGDGSGPVLGDPDGRVRLAPAVSGSGSSGTGSWGTGPDGSPPRTVELTERIGIDPHPIDPTSDDGRLTLLSFVWPDQVERFERLAAAIDLAREVPAELIGTAGRATSTVLAEVLARPVALGTATLVQHSIVWQYIPTSDRPLITAAIEDAGRRATARSPLVWVRFEPDEWDRRRVAVWVRRWPDGGDRLVAHADYHGRWLTPVPPPVL